MICCSASGVTLSPMIIFEKLWPSDPYSQKGPDGCLYAKPPNGYIDEELFLEWFKKKISLKPIILDQCYLFLMDIGHMEPIQHIYLSK